MKWYKFSMTFGAGHQLHDEAYIIFFDDNSEEMIKHCCRKWAEENSYLTDFICKFEPIDNPPVSWIKEQIEESEGIIRFHEENIRIYKERIKDIEGMR